MRYISVCSGIEAATVAWHSMGWEPAAFAEIEAFPSAVLAHHYPNVPNLGDFTKIDKGDVNGSIDLLVGGTPCQSFSVAGKRLGMDDPRGNLAIEYLRLAQRLQPRWLVFENVPGLLSSDEGRDFYTFLSLMVECGYGFAYRVLDAQYFGVAQRRRRVFVVGYLGDWRPAYAVLSQRESLSGHPAPRRATQQRTASRAAYSPNVQSRVYENHGQDSRIKQVSIGPTVHQKFGTGGNNVPLVLGDGRGNSPIAGHTPRYDLDNETYVVKTANTKANGSNVGVGIAYTLDQTQGQAIVFDTAQITSKTNRTRDEDGLPASTLNSAGQMHVAQTALTPWDIQRCRVHDESGIGPTLSNNSGGGGNEVYSVKQGAQVRRLTPRECERLQGFPDDYTLIPYRGKEAADGNRYRALGNSMAVPVMAWIGKRIGMANRIIG